ncbi:hypothetical protein [Aquimarina pacifica]|uniref:hypothetical protein n=1 Tax=Aquimarina pacifica TaxID=1296415 RepID=UPI00046F75FD|nr:hypothetical protein [Aquimarina pacifica]
MNYLKQVSLSKIVHTVFDKITSFFLFPISPFPLGFFRIGIGLIALFLLIQLWPYLLQLYGNFGFIQWAILETNTYTWFPSIGKLYLLTEPIGFSPETCVYLVFLVYGISLLGFILGIITRVTAFLVWICHLTIINSGFMSIYGLDTMLQICFFYAIWMPVGKSLTIFHLFGKETTQPSFVSGLSIRTLQLHLCIIYLNTSIAKMRGAQWWDGEAIWRALMQPQFSTFSYDWLSVWPFVPKFIGWSVLLIECGYLVFIWPQKTRKFWLSSILLLHAGIALLMGLPLFSLTMIVMNVTAFGWDKNTRFFIKYKKVRF